MTTDNQYTPNSNLTTEENARQWWQERFGTALPEDVKAGVLSEDLVYDAITDLRDAAFRMLELGTDILKRWI